MVVALQSVIYTYDGWTGPIYFGAEVRNPGRDLPRAMIGGVLLVLVIYLALNLAFLQVVPIEQMAGDPFVAATVAARLLGPAGDSVLRGLMVISLVASISAFQLMASRVPHAMAGDGLLPRRFEQVNAGGTPVVALFAGTLLALGFIASNSFNGVLALLAFFFVANYVLAFISLFVLRRRQPDAPRPFRVPWYPWVPTAALLGSVVFLLAAMAGDREHSAIAMLVLAASVPAYWLQRRWLAPVSSSGRSD
jgi:APA family basic amino acid/polyamine antiporter